MSQNGHGPGGAQVDQMLAQAAQQQAAQEQLRQVLDQTLRNPMMHRKFNVSATGVSHEGPAKVLEIPMPAAAARNLAQQLTANPGGMEEAEFEGFEERPGL